MSSDVFRVGIEVDGGRAIHNYDNVPAENAAWILRQFVDRSGDGIRVAGTEGVAFWTWDEVHAIRVVRGSFTVRDNP
jgi:hypothetical protein